MGISCFRVCNDGDTRIVGGSRYYEGIVEICRNGSWGVICDQGWNNISAALLCQERGFGVGKGFLPDDKLGLLLSSEIRSKTLQTLSLNSM